MERGLKTSELKGMARRVLVGKYGISAGLLTVMALVCMGGGVLIFAPVFVMAGMAVASDINSSNGIALILGTYGVILLLAFVFNMVYALFTAGSVRFFYNVCTGQPYGIGDLLFAFKNRWYRFVGLNLIVSLVGVVMNIPYLVVMVAAELEPWAEWLQVLEFLLMILGTVLGIVFQLFFGLASLILVEDRQKGVFVSMGESARLMRGNVLRLIVLGLSFLGSILLSVLSCYLGFLWTVPYMSCAYIYFYLDIKRRREGEYVSGAKM